MAKQEIHKKSIYNNIGVLGAGAWGCALANVISKKQEVTLIWARDDETCNSLNSTHENNTYLPGYELDKSIRASSKLADFANLDALLLATPTQYCRDVLENLAKYISPNIPILICAKGIEIKSGKLVSQILEEIIKGADPVILSGPSFAKDVIQNKPTAITLASKNNEIAKALAERINLPEFKLYLSSDVIGTQIGGALKNVLAIACGIVEGLGFGSSARSALTTRSFIELSKFAKIYGADEKTLMGLSGLGDLILTCSDLQSRNMSLGYELGKGKTIDEIFAERNSVSEGFYTAKVLNKIAKEKNIELPICEGVHDILYNERTINEVVYGLLNRPIKYEF